MNKLTSFTAHVTAEGQRISSTHSVIDESGKLIEQNVRETFIVLDPELQKHVDAINEYLVNRLSEE